MSCSNSLLVRSCRGPVSPTAVLGNARIYGRVYVAQMHASFMGGQSTRNRATPPRRSDAMLEVPARSRTADCEHQQAGTDVA